MVVHAAAHAALHQRANSRLLGSGVEQILGLVVAVHRASGETILRTAKDKSGFRNDEDKSRGSNSNLEENQSHLGGCWSNS